MRRFRVESFLRSSLWLVPLLCIVAAVGLSFVTIAVDRAADDRLSPQVLIGNTSGAQSILSTIATTMVTLSSLVLTVTTVAVQLAMGQFSPRIVRALLRDRASQAAVGLFVGTFAFAILSLRAVDVPTGFVPGLTIVMAVRHAYKGQEGVGVALTGDQQGIGSGPDVRAGHRDGSAKTTR